LVARIVAHTRRVARAITRWSRGTLGLADMKRHGISI
jgi:hypothetical protein